MRDVTDQTAGGGAAATHPFNLPHWRPHTSLEGRHLISKYWLANRRPKTVTYCRKRFADSDSDTTIQYAPQMYINLRLWSRGISVVYESRCGCSSVIYTSENYCLHYIASQNCKKKFIFSVFCHTGNVTIALFMLFCCIIYVVLCDICYSPLLCTGMQ